MNPPWPIVSWGGAILLLTVAILPWLSLTLPVWVGWLLAAVAGGLIAFGDARRQRRRSSTTPSDRSDKQETP